jgi:hypothetical protein
MKKIYKYVISLIVFTGINISLSAQGVKLAVIEETNMDFYYSDSSVVYFDTLNPNNLWQIGVPQKTVFNNAHPFSLSTAIVTDTLNHYGVNDTSSFEIRFSIGGEWVNPYIHFWLSGYYYVNSDTLTDYGTIEISIDNGNTWLDILNDSIYDVHNFFYPNFNPVKPTLTGNSFEWKQFDFVFDRLFNQHNVQLSDTIILKFSFISDSVQTYKDGLMYDNFTFFRMTDVSSVEEIDYSNLIHLYPIPTQNEVFISIDEQLNQDKFNFTIVDVLGKQVLSGTHIRNKPIDISSLPNGYYVLQVQAEERNVSKHLIITR